MTRSRLRRSILTIVGVAALLMLAVLLLFLRPRSAQEAIRHSHGLLPIGDSKSSAANAWVASLAADLGLPVLGGGRYGINGATVASMAAVVSRDIPRESFDVPLVLLALGTNDVSALPPETEWKAHYRTIVDTLQARWPNVVIFVARPYRRSFDAKCDLVAQWLDDLIRTYPGSVRPGMDERQWLRSNIDTLSFDGTHYSVAGERAAAAAWLKLLTE